MRQHCRTERGAILIQVAIAMVALMALSALAIDWGVKIAARRSAQNSADAGALAGAIALSYDNPTDKSNSGPAKQSALRYAVANGVWGQSPNVDVTSDVTFPTCPDGTDTCVRVDVYRNQERGNPLPTFFGGLVGVNAQGVKASATAQVLTGDTTECLRPWVVLDRWIEFGEPWSITSTFDKYNTPPYNKNNPTQENDIYRPPGTLNDKDPGTGFTPTSDYGRQFAIKVEQTDSPSSGWAKSVDLPRTDTKDSGANSYGANITSCSGYPVSIAQKNVPCPTHANQINSLDEHVYWAARGCLRVQTGTAQGQTAKQGVDVLVAKDSSAKWDSTANNGLGAIVDSAYSPSPRIVPIAVMDVDKYFQNNPSGSGGVVRLVNIFGFFIEGMGDFDSTTGKMTLKSNGKAVIGRLITLPGLGSGSSTIPTSASFLKTIILVR